MVDDFVVEPRRKDTVIVECVAWKEISRIHPNLSNPKLAPVIPRKKCRISPPSDPFTLSVEDSNLLTLPSFPAAITRLSFACQPSSMPASRPGSTSSHVHVASSVRGWHSTLREIVNHTKTNQCSLESNRRPLLTHQFPSRSLQRTNLRSYSSHSRRQRTWDSRSLSCKR